MDGETIQETWKREREEREASGVQFARAVASALTKQGPRAWRFVPLGDEVGRRDIHIISDGPPAIELWFWYGDGPRDGQKITLHFQIPGGEPNHHTDPKGSISFSASRDNTAIARDILRRLLPIAEACAKVQIERAGSKARNIVAAEEWAKKITAEIPEALNWSDGRYGLQKPNAPGTHPALTVTEGCVSARGRGSDGGALDSLEVRCFEGPTRYNGFDLKLERLPLEAWPFIVRLLKEAQSYRRKDDDE